MALSQKWEVVGGTETGGIVVRAGQGTTAKQLPRLATGAIVEELELVGERLHYKKVTGEGPEEGWVSLTFKEKQLLIKAAETKDDKPVPVEEPARTKPAVEAAEAAAWALRDNDYYVTLGVIFKKPGSDPTTEKMIKLPRRVGAVVHTSGKVWKSPKGGFWVELDTSAGDSGAGEKPGYVMIDASGFGTPGPCLQKAFQEDGQPVILKAVAPADARAWDMTSVLEKDFLVLQKSTVAEIRVVLNMLFGDKEGSVSVMPLGTAAGNSSLADAATVAELGLKIGDEVRFEMAKSMVKSMTLRVNSPLEVGVKLCDLAIKDDWTVDQVRNLLCSTTGLKKTSMIMARGKMGERVGEGANLEGSARVVDCGYKDGDEIGFIYMGDPAADLQTFLAKQ